jgi:Sulfatase
VRWRDAGLERRRRQPPNQFGTPAAYNPYAVGWAHAMDTPYQWTKQVASHWGGTRNGTIVHWPAGIQAKGELRSQFHHVIDIAPTVLEVAGLPEPTMVHGVQQQPLHGTSMVYSFDDPEAAERHQTQYFEMFCNRGIYHQGWTAVTRHSTPWAFGAELPGFDDDIWELYGPDDWTQAHNLASEQPDKLAELQRLFLLEAGRYNVFPLDDRRVERLNPDLAGRPQLIRGRSQLLFRGMGRLSENSVVVIKNKSHAITAQVVVPDAGADGVIVSQGRRLRRLEPVCHRRRPAGLLLQPVRPPALQGLRPAADPGRRAPGPGRVRLRRRRPGQGRHRHPLYRRPEGRRRPGRGHRTDGLLGR